MAAYPTSSQAQKPDGGSPQSISIAFGGDVTLGHHYETYFDEQVAKGKPKAEAMAHGFQRVKERAQKADLFVVNLECPFTDRGEKIPKNFNFRARPEMVEALKAGGVHVVSLANNHTMDFGVAGLEDTVRVLNEAGIVHFGAGKNLAEARRPAIVERNGIRIAFLGYFFLGDRNIEPPEAIATDTTPGVAGHHHDLAFMERILREDIALARTRADLVIPFFHWGREGKTDPEPYQLHLGRAAVEAGAAAVIGSHPHVLQGIELFRGAPIVYSLGNFVFGGNWNPRNKETLLLTTRFSSAGFLSAELHPAHSDRYPEVPLQPYFVEGEVAQKLLSNLTAYSAAFEATLPQLTAPPKAKPAGKKKKRAR